MKILQAVLFSFLLNSAFSQERANLEQIQFGQNGEISEIELVFDQNNVEIKKFHITEDKQIILDLKNTAATERVMRAFDTSEFSGSIVFVSAYQRASDPNSIRLAIQLRDNVRSVVERRDKRVVLRVENRFGVFNQNQAAESGANEVLGKNDQEGSVIPNLVEADSSSAPNDFYFVPKSDSIEDILENLTLSGRKKYIGKKITINVKDVKVAEILNMIAQASGFNIIMTNEVKALSELTLHLTNVAWDQALDTVMNLSKLVARKNGSILMVTTLAQATRDAELQSQAKKVAVKEEPLVTKIFPINYAKIQDLNTIIKDYLTPDRGDLSQDNRTNSIIVRDTAGNIEKIRKIIETLDTQTPQVLIESKIVEVTEDYTKEIGLRNGLNFGYDPVGTQNNDPVSVGTNVAAGVGQNAGPGFSISTAPSVGDNARDLFGLQILQFGRLTNLNFQLQLMENEAKARIISTPKVIAQNKTEATLSAADTTSFAEVIGVGDDIQSSFEQVTANLTLRVTPQVTNEGAISLDINLSKDQFGTRPANNAPPDKQTRAIQTSVLVDNGSTIALGGLYTFEKRETISGVPFLKDIPLIGWLFRTSYNPTTRKTELIIFITPRIINQEEAGLRNQS